MKAREWDRTSYKDLETIMFEAWRTRLEDDGARAMTAKAADEGHREGEPVDLVGPETGKSNIPADQTRRPETVWARGSNRRTGARKPSSYKVRAGEAAVHAWPRTNAEPV